MWGHGVFISKFVAGRQWFGGGGDLAVGQDSMREGYADFMLHGSSGPCWVFAVLDMCWTCAAL